jgi:hypothetical protein
MNSKLQLLNMLLHFQPLSLSTDVYYVAPELSKRLHSLFFIQEDMRLAKSAVKKFNQFVSEGKLNGHAEIDSIEIVICGMVTIYGRCFTQNRGNTRFKLSIFDGQQKLLLLHEQIMQMRHKAVAHREASDFFRAELCWTKSQSSPDELDLHLEFRRTIFTPDSIAGFYKLFEFVENYVKAEIEKERERVISRIRKLSEQEWQRYKLDNYLQELVGNISK